MDTRTFHRHDTTPARMRALGADGAVKDLTGASVTYTLQDPATGALKVNRATGVVRDQTLYPGECYYAYQASDVNTSGLYMEEWEVVYSDGTKETFPGADTLYVVIRDDADNT